MNFDLKSLKEPLEALIVLFYVAMALALLTALAGSPGWGFLFLLFGSGALIVRTTIETMRRQHGRPAQSPPPRPTR